MGIEYGLGLIRADYSLNLTSGKILCWQSSPYDSTSLSNNFVTSLYEDPEGNVWVGTYNGLCVLNKNRSGFTQYFHNHLMVILSLIISSGKYNPQGSAVITYGLEPIAV